METMEPGPAAAADVPENGQKNNTQTPDLVEKLAGRDALMGEKIKEAGNVVCLVGVLAALIIGLLIGDRFVGAVGALVGFVAACAGFTITAALVKTLYKYGDMVILYVEQMKALRELEAQRALALFISTPAEIEPETPETEPEAPAAEEETAAEEQASASEEQAPDAETEEEPVSGEPEADLETEEDPVEYSAQTGDTTDIPPAVDTSPLGDVEDPGVYPPAEVTCPFCGQTQPAMQNTCSYCGFQYTYNSGQDASAGISTPA